MTGFVISTHLYLKNGRVTDVAMIWVFQLVPGMLILPLAGVLTDRFKRKNIMLLADTLNALVTATLGFLFYQGRIEMWHVYLSSAIFSILMAFHGLAFVSLASGMVAKPQKTRMNALLSAQKTIPRLAGPLCAGLLMDSVSLSSVFVLDGLSFIAAVLATLKAKEDFRPNPHPERATLFAEAGFGLRYVWERPSFKMLLLFLAMTNFSVSLIGTYLTPMILQFATPGTAGGLVALGGLGMLFGSFILGIIGGPAKRLPLWIAGTNALQGVILIFGFMTTMSSWTIGTILFVFFFLESWNKSSNYALWQNLVPNEIQGRVFAFNRLAVQATSVLALITAGPLADRFLEPLFSGAGRLWPPFDLLFKTGPGYGMAFCLVLLGALYLVVVGFGLNHVPFRNMEQTPD